MTLLRPYPVASAPVSRLWMTAVSPPQRATTYLDRHGRPIGYRYLRGRFPLAAYQNVYANEPGRAEMPSGRGGPRQT